MWKRVECPAMHDQAGEFCPICRPDAAMLSSGKALEDRVGAQIASLLAVEFPEWDSNEGLCEACIGTLSTSGAVWVPRKIRR